MRNIEKGLARVRARSPELRSVDTGNSRELSLAAQAPPELDIDSFEPVRLNRRVLEKHRILVDESSGASGAYKMLRTRVLQRMRTNGWKSIAITGTCPEEGKSLTAINLSLALARDTSTSVVLADLDLRKPALHRHLGIRPVHGVGDYLHGVAELDHIGLRTELDGLGLLLNAQPFRNSSELLSSKRAGALVDRAKQGDGRIAVFDMPPVLASDDMLAFCPFVDAVLLVVSQGRTKHGDMVAARELLQNTNILGGVLNRSSEKVASYYYYSQT